MEHPDNYYVQAIAIKSSEFLDHRPRADLDMVMGAVCSMFIREVAETAVRLIFEPGMVDSLTTKERAHLQLARVAQLVLDRAQFPDGVSYWLAACAATEELLGK